MKTPEHPLLISLTPAPAIDVADPAYSRRQFCVHACQAASLVAVGAVLPACGGGSNPTGPTSTGSGTNQPLAVLSGTVNGRSVSVPVSAGGPLGSPGSAALVTSSLGSFLVARTAPSSFTVLTAVCTHEGCTVDLFNGELFVCPCHNSKYTTAGAVANGPASRPLQSFPSMFANGTLTFNV